MQNITDKIFVSVAILMLIGVLFSYSLPIFLENIKNLGEYHFVLRYALFSFLGILIMVYLSTKNPDKFFEKIGWFLFVVPGFLILIMPFLPSSIVPEINGARRWINLGIVKLAPVEFFKIGFIFFLSWSFTRQVKKEHTIKNEIFLVLRYVSLIGVFWLIILWFQSDLGQVMVMGLVFALMLFVAGGKSRTLFMIIGAGIIVFIGAIFSSSYRLRRFEGWLHSFSQNFLSYSNNTAITSYEQVNNALNAIYNGGITGVGIGNGVIKLGFLSDVHTDFVLAGIAEESGFIGIGLILVIISFLVKQIYKVAFRVEKKEYSLFSFGVGTLIILQFLINAFGETSVIPIKGIAVPFLTYGGSSLIALSVGIGMVLMISKKVKD